MLLRVPWYAPLLAATFILNLWIVSGVSLLALTRAGALTVAAVTMAVVLLTVVTRRPHLAAAAVMIVFAALVSRGDWGLVGVASFSIAFALVLKLWARVQRRPLRWSNATTAMNVLSLVLLGLVLVEGVQRGTFAAFLTTDLHQGTSSTGESAVPGDDDQTDVFVLMLDGYPRADVLLDEFGFDNRPFLDDLEARGFAIATESESNYPYTQATLISMLHMRPLHEIDRLDQLREGAGPAYPLMRQVVNENPVFHIVRGHGYRVVATSPGYEHVTLRQADVFLDDDSLNEAERQIIRGTPMQRIIDLVAPAALLDQYRQRVLAGFDALDEVVTAEAGPTFALVHVPSPHLPVVVGRDGSLLPQVPTEDMFRADPVERGAREAFIAQLEYLNERTIGFLERLLESEGSSGDGPVVVILSDHGSEPPARDGAPWNPEHYKNFLAVRAGAARDVGLTPQTTPVNVFPRILEALFGESHATWPDTQFPWIDVEVPSSLGTP